MLRSPRGWLALLVCISLGTAAPVAAQPTSGSEVEQAEVARQLFAEGIEFVEAGDWVQAEERFRRVLAFRSSHVVAYNLASALVNLGRPVEAANLLRSILRAPDADAATREAAQQLLAQTEPQIGTLTIRIAGDMTGVRFALDDKPLELTARVQTFSVDPGDHTLTAHREQTPLAFERVTIGGIGGLQADLAITLPEHVQPRAVRPVPSAASVPSPPPRPLTDPMPELAAADEGSHGPGVWLWAAGGVAVAAAAVLTVLLLASSSGEVDPVRGDTDPPLVRGRVR